MAEPITLVLGQETLRDGIPYLVVRVIEKSLTLFQSPDGTCYTLEESYAELRGPNGEVDFIIFFEQDVPFTNKKSNIKGLNPLTWRKK